MNNTPVNFKGLKAGAEYMLDDGFADDTVSRYRDAFVWHVTNYLTIVHQSGRHAADLVEALPGANEQGGYLDAFKGVYILNQTRIALEMLLEEDEELRALIAEGHTTTDEQDRLIRKGAGDFDKDFETGRDDEIRESSRGGFRNPVASAEDIADSAAAGGSRAREENAVAKANLQAPKNIEIKVFENDERTLVTPDTEVAHASEVVDEPAKPEVIESVVDETSGAASVESNVSESPVEPVSPTIVGVPVEKPVSSSADKPIVSEVIDDPAIHLFNERPVRVKIVAPDYSLETPNKAFRGAVGWLVDHVVYVASGSKNREKYPRIAPLMMPDVPEAFRQTKSGLDRIVSGIRDAAARLRPPQADDGISGILDSLSDPDVDPNKMMRTMLDALDPRKRRGDTRRPSYADSAIEPGGFQESEGDDWKTDKDDEFDDDVDDFEDDDDY